MVENENKRLMPIKAHYFFFMAAMGPILPQISMLGKFFDFTPDLVGYVACFVPVVYILVKPIVNFLADYFKSLRKFIFILMIITTTLCFGGFNFIPHYSHTMDLDRLLQFRIFTRDIPLCRDKVTLRETMCSKSRHLNCENQFGAVYGKCYAMTIDPVEDVEYSQFFSHTDNKTYHFCFTSVSPMLKESAQHNFSCRSLPYDPRYCDQDTTFWIFTFLLIFGTVGFNITSCISDAIYFDAPGVDQEKKYWSLRAWGTIGFGITAFLGGAAVHFWTLDTVKSFIPALFVMAIFSGFDLLSTYEMKVPQFSSNFLLRESWTLFRQRKMLTFLLFAISAGVLESFMNYFIFWHLEDVAKKTGYMGSIKLIEGCVIAAGCLGGELVIFLYSEKIIKRMGEIHALSICFYMYAIRFLLISLIPNPWWLVGVELIMRGCAYALTCACLNAYAGKIAPPGTSATAQFLGAGMKDILGYVFGPLIGGLIYRDLGGARTFLVFAGMSICICMAHNFLRPGYKYKGDDSKPKGYSLVSDQEDLESGKH